MLTRHVGGWRNQDGAEIRRGERAVGRHRWRRSDHLVKLNSVAGIVADRIRRRSDQCGGQTRRGTVRAQSFRRRRPRIRLNGQQVRHRVARGRKLKVGRVHDFGNERAAARNLDGLGAMVRFVAAAAAGGSGFSAAQILGAGQLLAAVIDHIVTRKSGRDEGTQLGDLHLDRDRRENQKGLQ